ncbi:glycosyltransferase family 2 protein [Carboxylicivirga linearis]|uniref:Glycosyltransferase n=1 Tax=Carboxylicivirga linearis TaxID=1628157 RepID=A0ABS5JXD4_9BACT|nr:glycosyltransferase [Carboxylicivirga linearis]MBS2099106.1 glycosyltransferase [Carboxylicivirga linearis]
MKVSFIVIGRNEGKRLLDCLKSIENAINQMSLDAEIIYVDSQSSDNSVELAKSILKCKVFRITGIYNSAIARNIGVKESNAENLVFLDGDMDLKSSFLPIILDECGDLKFDFVSGNFINNYYSAEGEFLYQDYYKRIYSPQDMYQPTTGGLFAIRRKIWNEVGGMRNRFTKGQDLDLGYRLAKRGYLLLRKKEVMALHHTINYQDVKRLWHSFKTGAAVYPRSVLYRSNILNKYVLKRMLTSDPTLLVLVLSITTSLLIHNYWIILSYLIITIAAVMYKNKEQLKVDFLQRVAIHILRDFLNVGAFLFFYPSDKKNIEYEEV